MTGTTPLVDDPSDGQPATGTVTCTAMDDMQIVAFNLEVTRYVAHAQKQQSHTHTHREREREREKEQEEEWRANTKESAHESTVVRKSLPRTLRSS